MLHLVADEFDEAVAALNAGLVQNHENEPLNNDMRRVVDAIEHLPGRSPQTPVAPRQSESESESEPQPSADTEEEPSHLFINAYTHRGKPH
jgi:hypothetical protein